MRFNPCGYAVDWARRPYWTKARFWDHPDAPLVDLYWYFTDLPFLPFPTVFNSKDWCEDPWHYDGLGEVFGAPRIYDGLEQMPGLTGGHICGTPEQFLYGDTWPPTGAPLTYDRDGIPTCCNRKPVAQVTSGSRPAAVVTGPPTATSSTSGSSAKALTNTITPALIVISSGARPSATAGGVSSSVILAKSGSSPKAIALPIAFPESRATSGSFPAADVAGIAFRTGASKSGSFPGATAFGVEPGEMDFEEPGEWTFTAPYTCWYSIRLLGGGGAGGPSTGDDPMFVGGGGAGGSAEASALVILTAGVTYQLTVGHGGVPSGAAPGDTSFRRDSIPIIYVLAAHGQSATGSGGAVGGLAADCVGDVLWNGGDGADGEPVAEGGGAGSSGAWNLTGTPSGDGNPGVLGTGGTAPYSTGGDGGDGGAAFGNGADGTAFGGGGGGAGAGGSTPGSGYGGQCKIIWPGDHA